MSFLAHPKFNRPPKNNEIEVVLFGPGYGECVLVHFGNDEWAIVDSCTFKDIKEAAPLFYLKELGKNPSCCVKAVVATHWDDDHIRKISQIVDECTSASFCISGALNSTKFLTLLTDIPPSILSSQKTPSGLSEFNKALSILLERNKHAIYAIMDRTLWKSEIDLENKLCSLSPHDSIFEESIKAILELIPNRKSSNGKIKPPSPNLTSVVLWVQIGEIRILLGADLEEGTKHKGWSLILQYSRTPDEKAIIFKVPHHGSKNGFHPDVWDQLLIEDPFCLIAPWNKSSKLPASSDIQKLKDYSSKIYLTAEPHQAPIKVKEGDSYVRRILKKRQVKYAKPNVGIIRLRKPIENDVWDIECFGSAKKIV